VLIEQAIFASTVTNRAQGYQLVARSPGLSESDARELAAWGPSHDSLLSSDGAPTSVNSFRLASGSFCVSRTSESGSEFSGRGGAGVYTQFLIVPPDILARFANNPFAVLRAAMAGGHVRVFDPIPEVLESVRLVGRSAVADLPLLAQLARHPGPHAMATLIQTALASDRLAVASQVPLDHLLAGLISTLPVECRGEFSFTTGLRFCTRRPVRIIALPADRSSWHPIARAGFTLLNLDSPEASDEVDWRGWAGHVARILQAGTLSVLTADLERARPRLTCAGLDDLADQVDAERRSANSKPQPAPRDAEDSKLVAQDMFRSDGAHLAANKMLTPAASAPAPQEDLSVALCAQPAETIELLERIDDLVFEAIAGDERALTELQVLWPTVSDQLDSVLLEQSREQYLRCALSIWSDCVEGQVHRPERAVAAIDVLCVLFEE
jgi:hypothetical protein